jgi:hypothetical protein
MSEESREVAIPEVQLPMSKSLPSGEEAETLFKWATVLSDTKYYSDLVASGGQNALAAILLAARDLDISASQAINSGMYIVKGKVSLSAQLMNTMVRRHGHSIVKVESTDTICTWKGKRKDNGDEMMSTFTLDDAKKAGLLKNPVWTSYPKRMLSNRAFSNLAKELFSDCIGNCVIQEGEIIDITPEVQEKPKDFDAETKIFIDKYNLYDLSSDLSKFIDNIARTKGVSRKDLLVEAAKNESAFMKSFDKYSSRLEPEGV